MFCQRSFSKLKLVKTYLRNAALPPRQKRGGTVGSKTHYKINIVKSGLSGSESSGFRIIRIGSRSRFQVKHNKIAVLPLLFSRVRHGAARRLQVLDTVSLQNCILCWCGIVQDAGVTAVVRHLSPRKTPAIFVQLICCTVRPNSLQRYFPTVVCAI